MQLFFVTSLMPHAQFECVEARHVHYFLEPIVGMTTPPQSALP